MNYKDLLNNELIIRLAREPENEEVWSEFYCRFHNYICTIIYKFSKGMNYKDVSVDIEDLAQEVYINLLKNNCRALKEFKGHFENAFYSYLKVTIVRLLLNLFTKDGAIKRISWKEVLYLDEPLKMTSYNKDMRLIDTIGENDNILNKIILEEDIEFCLNKIFNGKAQGDLYKLIFKLKIYKQLDPKAIASSPLINRKYKTVLNILSTYKPTLLECLKERMVE